ncbi:N-dimethylarginine dimethylaminohydrolase [Cytobacillus eiseniae]|uniref:N-dimethylarginine dimethylaminohydrolase n=1 Tax=Cytobacillus eiseniae TaxID=762947 RepID=A0ABS4RJD9_9BACI|nr:arginine deiminase family protein [Cytobacillus eiseniae]MBP2243022.1 N-dimethylarginine dimethylaminohydrolase [Cytobacillus eiseniae]
MSLQSIDISCSNEYAPLQKVIMCEPRYIAINDPNHQEFKNVPVNIDLALKQHRHFVRALKNHGVEVILLPPDKKYPDQVFTRDIGFTIGTTIYVAEMETYLRQGEDKSLIQWLKQNKMHFHHLENRKMEGGDILIDGKTIYAGVSTRTTIQAIEHLKTMLPLYDVIPISFNETFLHLDCVFNIVSPDEVIICPDAVNGVHVKRLASRYHFIEVTKDELLTHAPNILSIGNKKIISLPINEGLNNKLRQRGYDVIEIDITEITKSGGAFRCCTLPIFRGD